MINAMQKNGIFVISLDFELFWGVRDQTAMETFTPSAQVVRQAVVRLLSLFDRYQIHATWATVGFLFFQTREELLQALPPRQPRYDNGKLSPYQDLPNIGNDESSDPIHFGASLIEMIRCHAHQEVGTHTFSHYYCLERGQSLDDFRQDLAAARAIAERRGITLQSIVFPRNQLRRDYVQTLKDFNIVAYRGNRLTVPDEAQASTSPSRGTRLMRLFDSYLNLSGHRIYAMDELQSGPPFNIPASRFLRPFVVADKVLGPLKRRRVCDELTAAAQKGRLYHLWWHPHNFGKHLEANLRFLESILEHFASLNRRYGMHSCNMQEMAVLLRQP